MHCVTYSIHPDNMSVLGGVIVKGILYRYQIFNIAVEKVILSQICNDSRKSAEVCDLMRTDMCECARICLPNLSLMRNFMIEGHV